MENLFTNADGSRAASGPGATNEGHANVQLNTDDPAFIAIFEGGADNQGLHLFPPLDWETLMSWPEASGSVPSQMPAQESLESFLGLEPDNFASEVGALDWNAGPSDAVPPASGTPQESSLREKSTANEPGAPSERVKKRRTRSRLACVQCRKRKVRCTAEQPSCRPCLRSRVPCVYKPIRQGKESESASEHSPKNIPEPSPGNNDNAMLMNEGHNALPPLEIQEHLAELFFANLYGQAAVTLHKASYMQDLRAGKVPPVLNLSVCAVSARFSSHPMFSSTLNYARGREWGNCARDIVMSQYDRPSMTILACLLILGLHEFGTCYGGRSWALGGQAIRMAFALELHKEASPYDAQLSTVEREIRRRTMWVCYSMDRFTSSGTGRPMSINDDDISIQLPIKEKYFQLGIGGPVEDLDGEIACSADDEENAMSSAKDNMGVEAYYLRGVALYGRIINHFERGRKRRKQGTEAALAREMEYARLVEETDQYASNLPESLKLTAENLQQHEAEGIANQLIFLHIVAEMNILSLHKSAVAPLIGPPSPVTSDSRHRLWKAVDCANKISRLFEKAESYRVAGPFLGYCAFLSSTTLIFVIFSPERMVQSPTKMEMLTNLMTNLKFLSKMSRLWGVFGNMVNSLQDLMRQCAAAAREKGTADPKTGSEQNSEAAGGIGAFDGSFVGGQWGASGGDEGLHATLEQMQMNPEHEILSSIFSENLETQANSFILF